jgi:putative heme-binding domain-containing protein
VFDPSLVIGRAYQAVTVATADGRSLNGLLVEDGEARVVLKLQGGKQEIIRRDEIDDLKRSQLSLMPEGLENQLKPEEIINLFAFLALEKPPKGWPNIEAPVPEK